MKAIILGIKDYIKDCQHDHWLKKLKEDEILIYDIEWKEGNIWHYIKNRIIAHSIRKKVDKKL